jgi:hypothetical protein
MASRRLWDFGRLYWAILFTLISTVLSVLVIISGVAPNVLLDNHFYQVCDSLLPSMGCCCL